MFVELGCISTNIEFIYPASVYQLILTSQAFRSVKIYNFEDI